ncbi:hypothetical protein L1887_56595 [Cichorium endivia]|nr:hypothetical protein L1887_56595 [Cichorium endivia]
MARRKERRFEKVPIFWAESGGEFAEDTTLPRRWQSSTPHVMARRSAAGGSVGAWSKSGGCIVDRYDPDQPNLSAGSQGYPTRRRNNFDPRRSNLEARTWHQGCFASSIDATNHKHDHPKMSFVRSLRAVPLRALRTSSPLLLSRSMTSYQHTILHRTHPSVAQLVTELHAQSEQQDAQGTGISSLNSQDVQKRDFSSFSHKMIALEQDKAELIYAVLRNKKATRIFEAGTSYGVSTIYLMIASQAAAAAASAEKPMVWGTEKEDHKADAAVANVATALKLPKGTSDIPGFTMLRGDILEQTRRSNIEKNSLDAVLFDIWAELALPTFKLLEPSLKADAVLFIDNWLTGVEIGTYTAFKEYLEAQGWYVAAMPFKNGLGMATRV